MHESASGRETNAKTTRHARAPTISSAYGLSPASPECEIAKAISIPKMVASADFVPIMACTELRNSSPRCGPIGRNHRYATAARTAPVAVENLVQSPSFCSLIEKEAESSPTRIFKFLALSESLLTSAAFKI
eukprot:152860_1